MYKNKTLKSNKNLKRMVAFRFREDVIQALKEITEEFNRKTKGSMNKTDILEYLILNELKEIRKEINKIGTEREKSVFKENKNEF